MSTTRKAFFTILACVLLVPFTGCFGNSGPFGDSDSDDVISLEDLGIRLNGLYNVTYTLDVSQSTCNEQFDPYTVEATATTQIENNRLRLNFQFLDAPVPITGYFDEETDEYEGETTPVMLQSGPYAYAQEFWTQDFSFNGDETTFVGGSLVYFGDLSEDESEVDPDCYRYFNTTGLRFSF
ncbi:MAG: hypothetical protein R3284_02125 [Rubricoccaceae bacterium]|nr:hypothetical protein [Rubricoccaceae bacterium]